MPRKICCHCHKEMPEEVGKAGSHGLHPECVKALYPELYERWAEMRAQPC